MWRLVHCILFCTAVGFASTTCEAETEGEGSCRPPPLTQPEPWQNAVVSMVVDSFKGYFSHKIIWKKVPEYGNSYALHAAEDIAKGEVIFVIPHDAFITSNNTGSECFTILNFMQEYDKGNDSKYYPYVNYLMGNHEGGPTARGNLPTTWSDEAKDLLNEIVADDLTPQPDRYERPSFFETCSDYLDYEDFEELIGSEEKAQLYEDAYIYLFSRGVIDKMVVAYDMVNNRNGKWRNVEVTGMHFGEDVTEYAMRDIAKGEELFYTYSECMDFDCDFGGMRYTYDTPQILADFGYVENVPRRFHFTNTDPWLFVEVDQDENGELTLDWHYTEPSDEIIEWAEYHLERLQGMDDDVLERTEQLTSAHEKYMLREFHRVYKEFFELALLHKDDGVSNRTITGLSDPNANWNLHSMTVRQKKREYNRQLSRVGEWDKKEEIWKVYITQDGRPEKHDIWDSYEEQEEEENEENT